MCVCVCELKIFDVKKKKEERKSIPNVMFREIITKENFKRHKKNNKIIRETM